MVWAKPIHTVPKSWARIATDDVDVVPRRLAGLRRRGGVRLLAARLLAARLLVARLLVTLAALVVVVALAGFRAEPPDAPAEAEPRGEEAPRRRLACEVRPVMFTP